MRLRRRRAPETAARSALRDPGFPCDLPGVTALRVDYDPATWIRLPRPGEDRTGWVAAHLAARAADLGLTAADPDLAVAEHALDAAANTLLTHSCDLMALDHPELGQGTVAYVDAADRDLGLLEHGDPEAYVEMADLRPGLAPARIRPFPVNRPGAWRCSSDTGTDPHTGALELLTRGHRSVTPPGSPEVHLYGAGFYRRAGGSGAVLSLFLRARLELADGTLV